MIRWRTKLKNAVSREKEFIYENAKKLNFYDVYNSHSGSCVSCACREKLHKLLETKMDIKNKNTTKMNRKI